VKSVPSISKRAAIMRLDDTTGMKRHSCGREGQTRSRKKDGDLEEIL
jgi:hypothetical protein